MHEYIQEYDYLRRRWESSYSPRYKQTCLSLSSIRYQTHHLGWGHIQGGLINNLKLLHEGLLEGGQVKGLRYTRFLIRNKLSAFSLDVSPIAASNVSCMFLKILQAFNNNENR